MSSRVIVQAASALIKQRCACSQICIVRYAGHSHWQNIRHIKGAKDAQRSSLSSQLSWKIKVALTEQGGANPKLNSSLARAIKFGEENNIPSKSIQSMITKAASAENSKQVQKIEARGPSGSFLIIQVATDQLRRTQNLVNKHLAKCGGAVLTSGGTSQHFTEKGVIIAAPASAMSLEEAEEIAISVDAEEVELVEDSSSDTPTFQFTCDPNALHLVMKKLSDTKLAVEDSRVAPLPNLLVDLTNDERAGIETAVKSMKDHPDVPIDSIYDNISWP